MNDLMEKLGESPYELNEGEPMEPMEPMEWICMKLKGLDEKWMKWVRWTLGEWVWVPMRVSEKVPIRKSLSNWVWKSLSKCPYQTECEMSLSKCPYRNVPIEMSISKCPHQNINSTFYDSNCSSIGTRVSFNSTTYYQINHTLNHTHWSQWAFEELGGFTW